MMFLAHQGYGASRISGRKRYVLTLAADYWLRLNGRRRSTRSSVFLRVNAIRSISIYATASIAASRLRDRLVRRFKWQAFL